MSPAEERITFYATHQSISSFCFLSFVCRSKAMAITTDRVELSDQDAELLVQASRLMSEALLAYKQSTQVERRAALDDLVKASEEIGGYDL
jgi:hypothetical protein